MRTLLLLLVSLSLAACRVSDGRGPARAPATAEASPFQDPEVARIHARMMEAMAPDDGWRRVRHLEFDWIVERSGGPVRRSHRWSVWEGDLRVEGPTPDGRLVALTNVRSPGEGRAWLAGVLQEGARADSLLRRAYAWFVNDSYWLLMPYKWTDPGVLTAYLGERTDPDGRRWEVVELRFDAVGLTPQNVYHAYVDPGTGLMERWHHFREEGAEPLVTDWADWKRFGPVRLALDRPRPGGEPLIHFENVAVDTLPHPERFTPPEGGGT